MVGTYGKEDVELEGHSLDDRTASEPKDPHPGLDDGGFGTLLQISVYIMSD